MEQETAASLKIALRKLIHSSEVKPEAIQQIAEELSNEEISVQDWENLFKQDGADIALEQKIHTPQLTKLLTIRAIVIPQTVPEFLQWLNIQKISDLDESQKTSWAFQKKIKQFLPPEKISIGIQYILLQLLENKIKMGSVVWLLSDDNSIWAGGKKQFINNIKYDLKLIYSSFLSGRIEHLTQHIFRIQIGIWSEAINYWEDLKVSHKKNKKYQKYKILGKLFTEIKEYELAAYFYQISQSKISSKILKLLVNSNNITPETIFGLPIKESRPWINYISKFFNKDIDEQEKIFKQRREKYLELLRKYKEIDDYNQDIKINPNDPEYYYNRGNTRSDLGDNQGAIDDYTQVIKLNPNSAYAYILRGNVRSALGDKQGATDDYIQTIKLDHNFAYAYIPQGNVRTASGDNQDAIDDYIQVITLVNPDPKNRIIFIEQVLNCKYQGTEFLLEVLKKDDSWEVKDAAYNLLSSKDSELAKSSGYIPQIFLKLDSLLKSQNFREADLETTKIMLKVANREREGWLRTEDAEKFPCKELRSIDQLWLKYSRGKFGISVQQQIYQSLGGTKEY